MEAAHFLCQTKYAELEILRSMETISVVIWIKQTVYKIMPWSKN